MVRGLLEIPSLEEFRHLRVLDLMACSKLEDHHLENIVRLFQLRYLNLQGTRISKLPEQIGRLGCLEILDLKNACVEKLPASIVNLRKLMHLLVNDAVKFPDGIAKMQALETLKDVDASIQPFDFLCGLGQLLCGLGQLKNLRSLELDHSKRLLHEDTDVIGEDRNNSMVSSLCKLGTQNLRSLIIRNDWGGLLHEESLLLPTLQDLAICFPASVPTWVGSLRNLQRLRLDVEGLKQDDLCTLGALPSLLVLHLVGEAESNGKLRFSGEVWFRFLKIFIYDAWPKPVDMMFGAGSMPKLEKLELRLLCVVEADCVDFGIGNLPCVSIIKFFGVGGD
ncbi:hypothetical protein VPH35_114045 [Triticum aestivum]